MGLFGSGSLGSLIVEIDTDLTNLNKGLETANKKVQTSSGALMKMSAQVGRQMTLMGVAITAAMGGMVKASIDFESAFAGVRKTVDATEEEFQRLEDNFRGLSTEIPITATELARIGEKAGQLGIRGVENLTKFTETIALIGVTTDLTTEDAAIQFARIANVMKEPIKNIDRMGASVVALGNNFAANEVEITTFATRVAGAGQLMKMTTADVFGIGTAFTAVGVKAEMGGTAVQKVILKMIAAVASGNKDLEVFAEVAGMTVDEFVAMKKEDPSEVFVRFVEGIGELGDDAIPVLESLGLSNERVRSSFLRMASASDVLRDAIDTSGKEWLENTALLIEAEKRFKTTASQLKLLVNNIVEVGRKIGDTLLPVLRPMIEDFKIWIQGVGEWIAAHPEFTAGIAKAVTLFGLLLLTIGPILIVLPQLVTSIEMITTAISAMKLALGGVVGVAAAAFIGWKIGRVLGEVTGLDDALSGDEGLFTKMWEWLDKIDPRLETLIEKIQRIALATVTLGMSEILPPGAEDEEEKEASTAEEDAEAEKTARLAAEQDKRGIKEELMSMNKQRTLDQAAAKEKKRLASETKWYDKYYKDKDDFQTKSYDNAKRVLAMAAQDNKAAAMALQAIRIGEAIMNTAAGVTFALDSYPPPISYMWAALTAAMGAVEIATIASVGFAEGTDEIPAQVSPGEMIIPRTFASAIRAGDLALSGPGAGGGGRTVSIGDLNIIFEGDMKIASDMDIEDISEKIGESVEEKLRAV